MMTVFVGVEDEDGDARVEALQMLPRLSVIGQEALSGCLLNHIEQCRNETTAIYIAGIQDWLN